MRIVHITSVHPADDMRILKKQATSQANMGWDTHVVALDKTIGTTNVDEFCDVKVHLLPSGDITSRLKRSTLGAWRVARHALKLKADIVTAHDPELIPFLTILRLMGKKTIFDAHEDFVMQNQAKSWTAGTKRKLIVAYSKLLRFLASKFSWKILAATEGVAEAYPDRKTLVIKNYPIAGELGSIRTDDVAALPRRLVYVGGLSEVRGIREIIMAAEKCVALEGLDLAGPFESKEFEAEMRNLPGWSKVAYHGMQDRNGIAALFSNVRGGLVTLHPTPNHLHSIPIKMMEYFSAGLPPIASDFPYWRNLIEDGKTGFLVDPHNIEEIASRMTLLMDNEKCSNLVSAVCQGPQSSYNWANEADKLNTVISSSY